MIVGILVAYFVLIRDKEKTVHRISRFVLLRVAELVGQLRANRAPRPALELVIIDQFASHVV